MHPNVLFSSLLLATSAVARPDLLSRDGCFSGPHGLDSYCDSKSPMFPHGRAGQVAASAASASAQAASAVSVAAVSAAVASSASAASDRHALGRSQASVASAILAAKSSVQVQLKLAITSGSLEASPSSTFAFSTAIDQGFAFAQAARYGHG